MIGLMLALAAASGPSFDCAKAATKIERAICASEELSALDREEARLYQKAAAASTEARNTLIKRQRQFLVRRASCADSAWADTLPDCVRNIYMDDLATLRRMPVLAGDTGGLSAGPIRFRCDGGYPDAYLTRFALTPAQGYISIPANEEAQPLVAADGDAQRLSGRYDTNITYDARADQVRINARICLPAR